MSKIKATGNCIKYFLIFSLTPIVCAFTISLIVLLLRITEISPNEISNYWVEIISCVMIVGIFFLISREKKSFLSNIKFNKISPISGVWYTLLGLSVFFVLTIILNCLPFLQEGATVSSDLPQSPKGTELVLLYIAKCIFAPIVEEITFRGLIYSDLKNAFPKKTASLTVALVFAVLHFSYSVFTVISAFLMGLFFNFLVDRYNSILPCILIHCGYNFATNFIRNNITFAEKFETPIMVISIAVFIVAGICVVLDIRKHTNKINTKLASDIEADWIDN